MCPDNGYTFLSHLVGEHNGADCTGESKNGTEYILHGACYIEGTAAAAAAATTNAARCSLGPTDCTKEETFLNPFEASETLGLDWWVEH